MFVIDSDNTIHLTRGDFAVIAADAERDDPESGGEAKVPYIFVPGDIVRLNVYEKNKPENVVLQKDVEVISETESVDIMLTREDTKIGDYIKKPKEYHYEIEVNPDTMPQTILGHDKAGPKKFMLYPEGGEVK